MIWIVPVASAGIPEDLRPVAVPADAIEQFRSWRVANAQPPADPVCRVVWPEGAASWCLRTWDNGVRRWVTTLESERWTISTDDALNSVAERAAAHIDAAEWVDVQGMDARYLRLVDGDGWAVAGLLYPDRLAAKLGGAPIRVAMPAEGVLLAWKPGGLDLEKVMAVGVRELFDAQPGGVSPVVHAWDGTSWARFGEALPTPP